MDYVIKRDSYLKRLIDKKENGLIEVITGIDGVVRATCFSICSTIICSQAEWRRSISLPLLWMTTPTFVFAILMSCRNT